MPMGHSGPPGGGFPGGGDGGGPGGGGLSDDDGDDGDGPGPHRRKTHKTEKPEKPEKTPEKGRKQKAPVKDAKTTKATKDAKNAKKDATMKKKMTDKKVVKAPMKAKGKWEVDDYERIYEWMTMNQWSWKREVEKTLPSEVAAIVGFILRFQDNNINNTVHVKYIYHYCWASSGLIIIIFFNGKRFQARSGPAILLGLVGFELVSDLIIGALYPIRPSF